MLSRSYGINSKYRVQSVRGNDLVLGAGAYGTVYSCHDSTGAVVAVKQMNPDLFVDASDCTRLYREIKILRALGAHENIISLKDMEVAEAYGRLTSMNLVFDRYQADLASVIKSRQPLSIEHVEVFLAQIFRAVSYIHSANIAHRDLKPANILVNSDCSLVICDFGIARPLPEARQASHAQSVASSFRTDSSSSELTQYVVTRWYRSPELIEARQEKAQPSDVWSVGCIFAELFLRSPIFNGRSPIEVFCLINALMQHDMRDSSDYQDNLRQRFTYKFIHTVATKEAIDLLIKLFDCEPTARATAKEALQHPFLEKYASKDPIPEFSSSLDEDFLAFEATAKYPADIHQCILKEAESYNPKPASPPAASLLATQSIFAPATKKAKSEVTQEDEHGASAGLK